MVYSLTHTEYILTPSTANAALSFSQLNPLI